MSFSSLKHDDGSDFFPLGKRSSESFQKLTSNYEQPSKKLFKQSSTKDTTNSQKLKLPLNRGKTQGDRHRSNSKKRRVRIEQDKPYTFESIHATPNQFYNKFEQLLNFNTKLNNGLSYDIDGIERNLSKLQNMSKMKSNKEQKHDWLSSLNPIKKIKNNNLINFNEIAKKMNEQASKHSAFSRLDTTDGSRKMKIYPKKELDNQQPVFACTEYPNKLSMKGYPTKKKDTKRNILEEISSFDGSIAKDIEMYSDDEEDDRNYTTLKHMLGDMKDMLTQYSRNPPTNLPEDYENTSCSFFMPNKSYDYINDDNISFKGFKSSFEPAEQLDLLDKDLGNYNDSINFF